MAAELALGRRTEVLDIGANPLDEPVYTPLLKTGLCSVQGFEPQPDAFAKLQASKGELETYHPYAVGDGNTANFNIYGQSGLSSVFELDMESIEFLGRSKRAARLLDKFEVKTHRLDDIPELRHPDLLKIDVQGAEVMICESGPTLLKDVMAVVTELRYYPLYRDEQLLDGQVSALGRLGLIYHKALFTKGKMIANSCQDRLRTRALRSQAIDGDVVFVRDLRKPDRIKSSSIGHLALLADAVFQSYDLVIHCLDILVERGELNAKFPEQYFEILPAEVRKS